MLAFKFKSVFLWFLSVLSLNVFALGTIAGGGGKGVICKNPDGTLKPVQLLDLWEGETLRQQTPLTTTFDLRGAVDENLQNLVNSFPIRITGGNCNDRDCVLANMREIANKFLTVNPSVVRLRHTHLDDTGDAMELARPDDCLVGQIVNYQRAGGPILMNLDLFEAMDLTNQAALISHEAFYEILRMYVGETNSIRVRRALSYVVSGHKFVWPTPRIGTRYVDCAAVDQMGKNGHVLGSSVQLTSDLKSLWISTVFGTPLLGTAPLDVSKSVQSMKYLVGRSCRGGDLIIHLDGQPDTAVEFDRELNLASECRNGRNQITLNSRAPGDLDFKSVELKCQWKRK